MVRQTPTIADKSAMVAAVRRRRAGLVSAARARCRLRRRLCFVRSFAHEEDPHAAAKIWLRGLEDDEDVDDYGPILEGNGGDSTVDEANIQTKGYLGFL